MKERPSRLVLLGHPVHHSLSPLFQNAALRSCGVPLTYEAIDVPAELLDQRVRSLVAERGAGNVTIPHKEGVATLCDRCTPLATRVGAVNTFWVEDGALVGDNTDVGGFEYSVRQLLNATPSGVRVAVLGAGGAAAAVLVAVQGWTDCEVVLYNRSEERLGKVAARFPSARTTQNVEDAVRDAELVVNATAVGLKDNALPVQFELLSPNATLVDLVYRPGETAWVREARARGFRAADGLPMLVEQGALAFERWLGINAPRDVMWKAASEVKQK